MLSPHFPGLDRWDGCFGCRATYSSLVRKDQGYLCRQCGCTSSVARVDRNHTTLTSLGRSYGSSGHLYNEEGHEVQPSQSAFNKQIETLRDEAAKAGDDSLVWISKLALNGDPVARSQCAETIDDTGDTT